MDITTEINRDQILKNTELEDELSDLKQHADKMIRGFENFNNFSSNRAVWEMVQNACDLTTECEVIIDYSKEGFSFTHNGKPFTTKALISLIKQVSGKYGDDSDIPEVGKYGTGFLTTHTFGRQFLINSVLEAENAFFEIKDFLVDRRPKEWKGLSSKIKDQKDNVYKLIKEGSVISNPTNKTTFTYIPETTQELEYITESSKDLEKYVPLVLTINDRLKKVTILQKDGTQIVFERNSKKLITNSHGINLYKTDIARNGEDKTVYSIVDEEDQIEVILPINEKLELFEFSDRIAKLFLYYPLVGSEDFGLNFIINCSKFLPTEPRDGIHLKSNKDQVKDQEDENRRIIEKASTLVFDFLKSNILLVTNPLLYARVNFKRNSDNALLNEYFEELQKLWTNEFNSLPIVETLNGFKAASDVLFFDQELLECKDSFDDIFLLASTFWDNLPVRDKVEHWSRFADEWSSEGVSFIGHDDLVEAISEKNLAAFDSKWLQSYYSELILLGKTSYFSSSKLLPNLDGNFCLLTSLLSPANLTDKLVEIGKILIPQSIEKLVHPNFYFNFHFDRYNRKDFSNSVKTKLDEIRAADCICLPTSLKDEHYVEFDIAEYNTLNLEYFVALLDYCKLHNNIESQSKPSALLKIISKYYGEDDCLIHLPNLGEQEENLDVRSSRKILAQIFFNLLELHNQNWVQSSIGFLMNIAVCNEDSLKEVYVSSAIYPNQLNELKCIGDLKRDIDLSEEIMDLYDKVTGDTIRESLSYKLFNEFVDDDRFVTSKYLAMQIEDAFFNSDISNINDHPFKEDILSIIAKIKNKHYSELFPRLDDRKANLMLEIVTNENTKDDIFSIVILKEDQLKKLGKLVQNENFEAILNKATLVLQQEQEKQSDFRHKYEIGTNIERLIREKLSGELRDRISFSNEENLGTSDIQGGQDIIIHLDGEPIYFVEVKSRWNSENSVTMSKLQLERAVEQIQRYSLCSVDVSRYTGTNDRYNLPIEDVLPLTKFVIDIGSNVKPLIEVNLSAEKSQNESVHLIDYRGVIPQDIIQQGGSFDEFIDFLSIEIEKLASEAYA